MSDNKRALPVRWPLRNQILLPFLTMQVMALSGIAIFAARSGLQQAEADLQSRLGDVVSTLEEASFPLTPEVLRRLQRLSGADFVVLDRDDRILTATLPSDLLVEKNFRDVEELATGLPRRERESRIVLSGVPFYASRLPWRDVYSDKSILVLYRQATWEAARRRAMMPPLIVGAVLLLVTAGFTLLFSYRLVGRLTRVQKQLQQIAVGNFTPGPLPPIDDELRDVSRSIQQMAELLAASLEQQRDAARSALLTQLVGGLAHQLRNAITGARISLQLHQRRSRNSPDEAIAIALQQLELVEEQLKALLRVVRGVDRSVVAGDLVTAVEATLRLVQPIATHRQIELTAAVVPVDVRIADADGMRAALLNLLLNAIEAAGPGGKVSIELHGGNPNDSQQLLTLDICDNGPGIAAPEEMFRPFFSTKQEGIGLGLALAKQGVEDCGGTLTAARIADITRFRIVLPLDRTSHNGQSTAVEHRASSKGSAVALAGVEIGLQPVTADATGPACHTSPAWKNDES